MLTCQQLALLIAVTALSLPAFADNGKDAYKQGVRAERQGNLDAAYEDFKQAYALAPTNPKYFAEYTRTRFNASAQHIHNAQLLRNTGALTEAMAEFQRAVAIDNSSYIGQQEVRQTAEMIRRKERPRPVPKVEPSQPSLADNYGKSVELQPLSNAAITLHLTANADIAYKTICKLAGLNVVIDPDYRPQKITVDLTDVTLREALDLVRIESKTFWRPVLSNTIVVASDSPAKRKELEQNVMKTFYLRNISAPAELQDAANVMKQMLDVTHVQLLQAQDALIVRGTPDQMILAEKLLSDIDKPKSEVIIDITVMEVSRDRLRTLGTNVPTSASIGVPKLSGGSASGTSGSTAAGGIVLGSFVLTASGGSVSFLASDSNTKILQSPQIRTLNDEKATLRIGDRVPIATGSFQPGVVGGGGVSPLIGTQFTYLDVGVNIDITPHIHSDNEVTLKMSLEISSVTGQQNIGGITQPVIGQRRIEHETRLTDGEVNLLGGILEDSETKSLSGYPWLSSIPILKYLFAQDNRQRTQTEIVFAITPHIVRALELNEDSSRAINIGTGNSIELQHPRAALPATADHPSDPAKPPATVPQAAPSSAPSPAPGRPAAQTQIKPQPAP